jgi:chorismate mutase
MVSSQMLVEVVLAFEPMWSAVFPAVFARETWDILLVALLVSLESVQAGKYSSAAWVVADECSMAGSLCMPA